MKKYFLLVLSCLFFMGCNPVHTDNIQQSLEAGDETLPETSENDDTPDDVPKDIPIHIKSDGVICFNDDTCLEVAPRIGPLLEKYNYLNPFEVTGIPNSSTATQYIEPHHLLDLRKLPDNLYLGKYFKISEFINFDRDDFGLVLPILIDNLDIIRESLDRPIIITSGYRSPAYNITVPGSATWSRHMYGDSVDMVLGIKTDDGIKVSALRKDLKKLIKSCEQQGAHFRKLYAKHVHCDWRNHKLPPELFPVDPNIPLAFLRKSKPISEPFYDIKVTKTSKTWILSIFDQSHEADALYDWQVFKDKVLIQESFSTTLSTPPLLHGDYTIKATSGTERHIKVISF